MRQLYNVARQAGSQHTRTVQYNIYYIPARGKGKRGCCVHFHTVHEIADTNTLHYQKMYLITLLLIAQYDCISTLSLYLTKLYVT